MDKLKMHSMDGVAANIEKIGALFPNCVTETMKDGKLVRAIDFDMLRQELSDVVVEGPTERYQFTWPEKRKSALASNAPITATLRPCREESVNFDTTENIYIEGDNLDVLKLLQETYLGKIRMIYIDPPYNTGHDFVYSDVLSKKRYRNDGEKAPMYYAENSHPAIVTMEMFNMVKLEMERRKTEKEKAVGNTRYTSKYPFSGILICGTCGSRLRRHVRKTGSGKLVPSWGCSNRILNGREVCDSYHVNEDVLYATYHAAVQAMVEDAGSILSTLESATEKELQPSNKAALDEVEQKIIDLQEKVLALHRQKRAQAVNDAYYNAQVNDYSQQLAALEDRQQALQTADARYATVRMWLADFQQHMQEGDATDDRDGKMMKSLVESIIIWPDRMEIHFKCGVNIEQKYVK